MARRVKSGEEISILKAGVYLSRRKLLVVFLVFAIATAAGCASILEDEWLTVNPHLIEPQERSPEEQVVEISNYDELKEEIMGLVMDFSESGKMIAYTYDGDISADIAQVRREILGSDPIGAYAVESITGVATRIVSYSEIEIEIAYKRTQQQVESIVNVSTLRYLRIELLRVMSGHQDEALFRTSLQITDEIVDEITRELYYQNPRNIVMLPVTAVEAFPRQGEDRIYELRFRYIEQSSLMQQYGMSLSAYARRIAGLSVGENDAEILLSLAENLMAASIFEQGLARTISVHGAQNLAATAYGALVNGRAVGEGYAMAFKALSDVLGFDCRVVLGHLDGMIHAWNIIFLYGDYYHVDIAMCDVYGIETAFIKTDEDFMDRYSWDIDNTVRCSGLLTYEELFVPEEIDDTEDGDGTEDTEDTGDATTGDSGDTEGAGTGENPGVRQEPPVQPGEPGEETPEQPDEPDEPQDP